MQVNEVRPVSGGLLVLSGGRGERLPLETGTPFLAEVVEAAGGQVLLSIDGRLIRGETSLPLEPGASVWLTVKESSPHRVVLALHEPGQGAPPFPPAPSGVFSQAVSFLLAQGRPVTPSAVEAVASILGQEPDLAERLSAVQQLLSELTALSLPLADELREALSSAVFQPVPDGELPDPVCQAGHLAAVVRRLGLNHEARLARFLHPGSGAEGPAERASSPPAQAFPLAEDLKGLLLALRQAAGDAHADVRLAEALDGALRNLTGQRLLAPAPQGPERLEFYLQFPVAVGHQRHTVELSLFRDAGSRARRRLDRSAPLRVSCRLDTTYLGPVRVDLALRARGAAEAHLYLSAELVMALFRQHEPELREALAAAGLRLGRVTYSLVTPHPRPPAGADGPPEPPAACGGTIDLRL